MNYSVIKKFDISNGPGVRVSLFVSGCTHHCKGCFNPETWSFDFGQEFTTDTEEEILEALRPDHIRGLSLLGGEPFEPQNQARLLPFVKRVREAFPEKTIWCYTGYTLETDILAERLGDPSVTMALLRNLDVLVDGEFHEAEKDPSLRFRGSKNQRIIDVTKSLEAGKTVLWDGREEP